MRVLAISDLRASSPAAIPDLMDRFEPDLILYGGDDVARFGLPDWGACIDDAALALEAHLRTRRTNVVVDVDGTLEFRARVRRTRDPSVRHIQVGGAEVFASRTRRIGPLHRAIRGSTWSFTARRPRPIGGDFAQYALELPFGLAGVLGNDCAPSDATVLRRPRVHDLHQAPWLLGDWAFIGLAGAPNDDGLGSLLFPEDRALQHLEHLVAATRGRRCVLVSHAPPRGVLDFATRYGGRHVGSTAVRKLLDHPQVEVVVCGHVHRLGGQVDDAHGALVLNVASHDGTEATVRFAVFDLGDAPRLVEIGEAPKVQGVEQVSGIGVKRAESLACAGILRVADLLETPIELLEELVGGQRSALTIRANARALTTGESITLGRRPLPDAMVLLDCETSADRQDDPWLVAVGLPDGRVLQFEGLDVDAHATHLGELDALMGGLPNHVIVRWGGFDRAAMERGYRRCGLPVPTWLDPRRWLDACAWVRCCVALPLGTYSLKALAKHFGFNVRHPHLNGLAVGMMYQRFRDERVPFDVARVREYNADDVLAMRHVIAAVTAMLAKDDVRGAATQGNGGAGRP